MNAPGARYLWSFPPPRWATNMVLAVQNTWQVVSAAFDLIQVIQQKQGDIMAAMDDLNTAVTNLEAEIKVNRQAMDDLATLVRNNQGGAIPTDQINAIVARVNQATSDLAAGVTADSQPPAAPVTAAPADTATSHADTGAGAPTAGSSPQPNL